jgi:hypothetical protein
MAPGGREADRLRELDREPLIYEPPKPGPGGSGPRRLTPLELLDHLAALVPPPRIHRHRYFGVLAPNSPLRTAVTALAPEATNWDDRRKSLWDDRRKSLWDDRRKSLLEEVFPLVCPHCGDAMRIIAFITDGPTVRDILVHLGEPITPPIVAPARGPPLWELPPAGQREIDPQAQPAPDYEFDQHVAW